MNKENNFGLLRHFAAILVIYAHSYDLLSFSNVKEPFFQSIFHVHAGTIGVVIFFIVSGYLITGSWNNTSSSVLFIKKRVARIFPALFINTILVFIWTGFALTNGEVARYFTDLEAYKILSYSTIFNYPALPDYIIQGNFFHSLNGSLWTLRMEVLAYFSIPIVFLGGIISKKLIKNDLVFYVLFMLALAAGYYYAATHTTFYYINMPPFSWVGFYVIAGWVLELFWPFYLGAMFYHFKNRYAIPLWSSLLAVPLLAFVPMNTAGIYLVSGFALFFFTFGIAYFRPLYKYASWFEKRDYSYGLYIYAFPVQQSFIYFTDGNIHPFVLFLLSTGITAVFAALSWHFVEKPVMDLLKKQKPIISVASK